MTPASPEARDFKVGPEHGEGVERSHLGRKTPPIDARTATVVPRATRGPARAACTALCVQRYCGMYGMYGMFCTASALELVNYRNTDARNLLFSQNMRLKTFRTFRAFRTRPVGEVTISNSPRHRRAPHYASSIHPRGHRHRTRRAPSRLPAILPRRSPLGAHGSRWPVAACPARPLSICRRRHRRVSSSRQIRCWPASLSTATTISSQLTRASAGPAGSDLSRSMISGLCCAMSSIIALGGCAVASSDRPPPSIAIRIPTAAASLMTSAAFTALLSTVLRSFLLDLPVSPGTRRPKHSRPVPVLHPRWAAPGFRFCIRLPDYLRFCAK